MHLAWDLKLGSFSLWTTGYKSGTASLSLGLKVEKDFQRGPENGTLG